MRVGVGIFVGGSGSRMGGAAKGLLPLADGEALLARLQRECRAALPSAPLCLVGAAEAYARFGLPALADQPKGVGPLGGLAALLDFAEKSELDACLAFSCDLPYLSRNTIARLAEEAPDAAALAPRRGDVWEPLCARYSRTLLLEVRDAIAADQRSLQRLFARLDGRAQALALDEAQQRELFDWDTPDDIKG